MKEGTIISGESYTHKILWGCATNCMEAAEQMPSKKMYFYLSGMVMVFFSFESYLNDLGDRICPEKWKDEKKSFGKGEYQGTLGKFNYLVEQCKMSIDKSKGPYQIIENLSRLRTLVAHGRTEKISQKVRYKTGYLPSRQRNELEKYVSEDAARRSLQNVKDVITDLQEAARAAFPDSELPQSTLGGLLGFQSSDYELKEDLSSVPMLVE